MTLAMYKVRFDDGRTFFFQAPNKANAVCQALDFQRHATVTEVERVNEFRQMDGALCEETFHQDDYAYRPTLWPQAAYD